MLLGRTAQALSALAFFAAAAPAAAQQMPCANEIIPLRGAVEKAGLAVKAAIEKRVDRSEVCERLKTFASAESKFVKYLETNAQWCSVPPQAMQEVRQTHARTLKMRGQACSGGPVGGRQGPPPGPGLSEALGTNRAPVMGENKNDRGTYNTLTGNPLQR